jgi:hypothetical protein
LRPRVGGKSPIEYVKHFEDGYLNRNWPEYLIRESHELTTD